MPFDLRALLEEHAGQCATLYGAHVNPRFARAMGLSGFDRCYVRGRGAYLWDAEGRRYLDMLAGYGVFNIGRHHPVVMQALRDFMDMELPSLVQRDTPLLVALAARELKARAGLDLDHVYFGSTGAEANETAIKFARRTTGRPRILHAASAFHGLTTGALALNGSEVFREGFGPLLPTGRVPFGDAEALRRELEAGDVAAFFVEPVQGKGVHVAPEGYLREAARLCREYGALFVVDEVQTGVGRTGRFLALHHEEGVEPDMVLMSKALSGGYIPVSAVLMTKRVYDSVFSSLDRSVVHSSTFGKSNLAATALLATLSVVDDEGLAERAARLGDRLMDGLRAMAERYEFMGEVRGRGLMIAIDFVRPRSLKLRTAWKMVNALSPDLFCQAVTMPLLERHSILTQVAGHGMNVVKILAPLVITEKDKDLIVRSFDSVIADCHKVPGSIWDLGKTLAGHALKSGKS